MKKCKFLLIISLFICMTTYTFGQANENTSIQIYPAFDLGLGGTAVDDFGATIGGGANIKLQHLFASIPFLFIEGDLNIGILPYSGDNLILISGGISPGINLRIGNRLSLDIAAQGGWYFGLVPDHEEIFANPYFGGNVNVLFDLTPSLTLSAGAGYKYYVYPGQPLYHGLSFSIGTVFRLGSMATRSRLKMESIEYDPVFPILYEYYSDNSFGTLKIKNTERNTINNLTVSFYVDQYMEQPMQCADIPFLKSGNMPTLWTNSLTAHNFFIVHCFIPCV